nr:uncharacterized protein C20orf141 homolog isoform X2 [Microcebus murinus]
MGPDQQQFPSIPQGPTWQQVTMPQLPRPRMAHQGGRSRAQLLDSVLGLGALGLTIRAVFSMAGPTLLLLLLLVSFLAFDLLHRPAGPTLPPHRLLTRGQSQGAGEGPGQQEAVLPPAGTVTGGLRLRDALLLLLMGLGLLLGARGMPAALLGLAFCLHPWA